METLPKDIYFTLAKDMEIRDLIDLCIADKRANEKICKNEDVWRYRLEKEFPDWKQFNLNKSLINTYVFLYQLKILKKKLNLKESIYQLYILQELRFHGQLKELPREIGNLVNLQELYLSDNQLTEIPKEIGNLSKLQILSLTYNGFTQIPKEIGNLFNLRILGLYKNKLKVIPKEIGNLSNLQELFLSDNKLTKIPKELGDLRNLQKLNLN